MATTASPVASQVSPKIDALKTTIAINASNPTIVACWDLGNPSKKETTKVFRPSRATLPESVNPSGDHREKVLDADILPKGKYGAICKIFMGFIGLPGKEWIGTGWLISPTLIATAGHCGVEEGHALKYIKIYFGYTGPESIDKAGTTYRYGTRVALPAEFLKTSAATHDVSFVELNEAVTNIAPIKYVSTPMAKTEAKLGVIGYPGDLDNGNRMYQEWVPITIDLASTGQLLSYDIDTNGGQSGSPVLMNDPSTAVGVHVQGGFPNIGSVIGPAGNKFGEYILALAVSHGQKSANATKVAILAGQSLSAPGFSLIRVEPAALKESAESTIDVKLTEAASEDSSDKDDSDSDSDSDDGDDGGKESGMVPNGVGKTETQLQVDALWGHSSKKSKKEFHRLSVFFFPESLVIQEADDQAPPPTTTQLLDATKKAVDHPDVQTTFFIGFPPEGLDAAGTKELKKLVDNVQSWQAWSSTICEGNVQQQIDKKALSAGDDGQFARSTYRAKVFDYLFRQSTWFSKNFDQNMTKHIEVQKVDFHTAILKAVLEGFAIPETAFQSLEKILTEIGDNITLSKQSTSEKQQYWLMLTRYDWQPLLKTAQPIIRVISFSVDQKMSEYTVGKSKYTSISIDLQFGQYQADFINSIYKKIRKSIDDNLVKAGMALVTNKTITVPL